MACIYYANKVAASSSIGPKLNDVMVIDIRGGKVDIIAYNNDASKFDVLIPPIGNDCGDTKVNQHFAKFLSTIVGDEDFDKFTSVGDARKCEANCVAINRLIYNEFEQHKVEFREKVVDTQDFDNEIY